MKKRYLFVSSFFVIGTIFTLICFVSYKLYDKQNVKEERQQPTREVDTVQELRANTSMKYVIEVYDGTTGVLTMEEGTVPSEIAGKTREELTEYFSQYNEMVQEEGVADGPDRIELVSFSKDKVVVRQTYAGAEEEKGFYLKIDNEEVVIFHNDMVTPYEYTGIQAEILPEDEREKLEKGYFVEDEKELYSVLENLSS